jgi:hypothetical protein
MQSRPGCFHAMIGCGSMHVLSCTGPQQRALQVMATASVLKLLQPAYTATRHGSHGSQ